MPNNTPAGFIIGMLSFVLAFALVWHIWWLAGLSALAIFVTVVLRSLNEDVDYYLSAAAVRKTEEDHYRNLETAKRRHDDPTYADTQPVILAHQVSQS